MLLAPVVTGPIRPEGEIILYQSPAGSGKIRVLLEGETVWLPQVMIAELFQTSVPNINIHLKNIYEEGEVDEAATVKEYLIVRQEGSRQVSRKVLHYSLDAILAVGYRAKSPVATRFRQWATARLREYLVKGFTLNDDRLKGTDSTQPNMGLAAWKGDRVINRDVGTTKNYLDHQEIDTLNRITVMFLDQAEFRAPRRQDIHMHDWQAFLDKFLRDTELPVLADAGLVSHENALVCAHD